MVKSRIRKGQRMKDKPRILIVDDQPRNIELLEAYLVPQGYEVVTAATGEEALEKLSNNQIDLMLLDVMMPGMDGFEVTRRVRQDNEHRLVPIILVTALRETQDRVKGIEAGCDDFISKPVDKMELLARVKSLLKVKAYNDLMGNYQKELESEVNSRTEELKCTLEDLQQDIIERKRAEGLLKESETKYRNLVENISDVLYELDSQVAVVYISPVIRSILGYDSAEIIGKNLIEFVYKDDMSILEERFSELRKGIEFPFDYRFVNKSGELRWARTNTRPIMEDGLFKGARGTLIDITPQKQLEDALRESAEKYQRFFMTCRDCVFITSKEGNWIDMNDAAVELFGYPSREELMQVKIPDLYMSMEERTKHGDIIAERGYCKEFPVDLRKKDGTIMHTLITSVALCGAEKEVIGFQGTIRDVTAKKWAEKQALIFRYFAEASGQGIGMATLDGYMTYVNPTLCRLLGEEKPEDLCHKKFTPYYPQEMRERLEKEILPVVIDKGQWTGELVLISVDGKYTPTIENFFLIRDETGEPLSLAVVITDITKHKQAEEALKLSEQKYRALFENSVEGIFQTSSEGRFISANPSQAELFGYDSPEELIEEVTDIGRQHYVHPEDRETFKNALTDNGIIKGFEVELLKKDGTSVWASISARAVMDDKGRVLSYEGTTENITGRKLAEENLKESAEKLRKTLIGVIRAMSLTVETRDPYTAGHQRRVSNLARVIAQDMGLPKDTIDTIRTAGVLHDIGKIAVPSEILSKPTKLTDIEFSLIKVHSQSGYDILKDVGLPYHMAEAVLQHHERLDGSGYPQGLKNGQILLEAKILAVADVVEAIASHRPYRPAKGIDIALEEIEKNKDILYDAGVVEACTRLFKEKGFSFE
jgi:PAS domain S-box-containing protein